MQVTHWPLIPSTAKPSLTYRLYTSRWERPQWDKTTLAWLGSAASGDGAWQVLPLASTLGETLQSYSNT